ncbi:MAG: glycosyltransferase family 9 protein [Simkaniaceae bacterium]|nr:glycosyltransferase family 9 protein [Candidatus Sacchlamyda saccharinae]
MRDFLIVKTSSIGDVIQCFHLVDYLKVRFPGCVIDWVVEKEIAPLLRAHPHLDRVLVIDTKLWRKNPFKTQCQMSAFRKELRKKNYDTLFDLQGNTKSGCVTAFAKARQKVGFGWQDVTEKPNYFSTNVHLPISHANVRERYLQLVQDYFGDKDWPESKPLELRLTHEEENRLERLEQLCFERPRLMVCFGSNWRNKTLTEETLLAFLQRIDEKFAPSYFFIYGNENEKKIADRFERSFSRCSHSVGNLSLPLWQRFMQVVEGVISMDSAALHLCATTATPTFSLFGPSSALAYKPVGDKHYAFQGSCPYEVQFERRCPHLRTCESGACLREASVDLLFEKFDAFWERVSCLVPAF